MQNTTQSTSLAPKNFFIQIGIIASLYASAVSFLVFLFSLIDKAFPDMSNGYYYDSASASIRFSISVLVVAFPVFIWLGRVYRKFVQNHSEVKDSKLRKWMIYLTLFVTGLTMAIDVIVLINAFLSGEGFVWSFILKVLAVFVVALSIFMFCLKDLKGYFDENPKQSKMWSAIVSLVVLAAIIAGLVFVGSPSTQRSIERDNTRVGNLQDIQWQVVNYYQQKGVLPQNLEAVKDPISGNIIPTDPSTKEAYSYKVTGGLTFELCATFETELKVDAMTSTYEYTNNENWKHGVGQTCFSRTIDPQRYPRIKN